MKYSFIESVPVKLGMHLRGQYSTELLLPKNVGQGSRSSKKILKHKSCFLLHKAILKLIFITQSVPFFLRNTNVCFTELQQIWAIKSNFSQASKKVSHWTCFSRLVQFKFYLTLSVHNPLIFLLLML